MLKFGDKIRFKNQKKVHEELRGEFCLLGIDKSAVAYRDWEEIYLDYDGEVDMLLWL